MVNAGNYTIVKMDRNKSTSYRDVMILCGPVTKEGASPNNLGFKVIQIQRNPTLLREIPKIYTARRSSNPWEICVWGGAFFSTHPPRLASEKLASLPSQGSNYRVSKFDTDHWTKKAEHVFQRVSKYIVSCCRCFVWMTSKILLKKKSKDTALAKQISPLLPAPLPYGPIIIILSSGVKPEETLISRRSFCTLNVENEALCSVHVFLHLEKNNVHYFLFTFARNVISSFFNVWNQGAASSWAPSCSTYLCHSPCRHHHHRHNHHHNHHHKHQRPCQLFHPNLSKAIEWSQRNYENQRKSLWTGRVAWILSKNWTIFTRRTFFGKMIS